MNVNARFLLPVLLAVWLLRPAASAQIQYPARFDTPAAAAKALTTAETLQARVDLLGSVATSYLQAHAYETLPPLIASLPVAENAAWQRTFLLADLQTMLGATDEALRLLGKLPASSLGDPAVRKFRHAHPDLYGDSLMKPPPDFDAGPPEAAARDYLDTMQPGKAWRVIAAHTDSFLDHLNVLHDLTAQIFDENLAPKLLPLLEDRIKRRPDTWELRLTLAQYQFLTGDTAAATESFQQVFDWTVDHQSPAATPAQRVAAMQGFSPSAGLYIGLEFWRVKTIENARDVALICLARLANERGEGTQFIRDLQKKYEGDEIGWITALMLIDSKALALRELKTSLAKGPPPGLTELALPWLQTRHPNQAGMDQMEQERQRLAGSLQHRSPAVPAAAGSNILLGSNDPAEKERFLQRLTTENADSAKFLLPSFLDHAAKHPDDDFFTRGAAILMAKMTANVDANITLHALGGASGWSFLRARLPSQMGLYPRVPPSAPAEPPINEQIKELFLGESSPGWSQWVTQAGVARSTPPPPPLAPALEKLAGDASSPLHVPARVAEAYVLHGTAGQEDRALIFYAKPSPKHLLDRLPTSLVSG